MASIYQVNLVGFWTIVKKEIIRFTRIWSQTLLPSAMTTTLYFIIFGQLIGSRIGIIDGVTYMQFIVPGLIMMSVITNAYANVSSSFFSVKFQRSIEELLISPLLSASIIWGYVLAGMLRGIFIGIIVGVIALCFTHIQVAHAGIMVLILLLSTMLFSLAGFLNGLFAKKFDDVMLVPTFVLTPLTYLGGVFYSIHMLPAFWQKVSMLNPILYLVNAFRFGILGVSDIGIGYALGILVGLNVLLYGVCLYLMKIGYGIRS